MLCSNQQTLIKRTNEQLSLQDKHAATIEDNRPLPDCAICLEKIEPCTPKQRDTSLYCSNQLDQNRVEDSQSDQDKSVYRSGAIAHGHCIKQLYQSWKSSDGTMRLPHCPQCTNTLSSEVTLAHVSANTLLNIYRKTSEKKSTISIDKLSYLGQTIMHGIRSKHSLQGLNVNRALLSVIAMHAKPEDAALFSALQDAIASMPQADILKSLSYFSKNLVADTPVTHKIRNALINALVNTVDGHKTKTHAFNILWAFSTASPETSDNRTAPTAILDALSQKMTVTEMVELHETTQKRALEKYLSNPYHAGPHNRQIPPSFYKLHWVCANLLIALERKLTQTDGRFPVETLEMLNKHRKHDNNQIRQICKKAWSDLAAREPTAQQCFDILVNKLASPKGLSAKDIGLLENAIHRLTDTGQLSLGHVAPFAQAVLAYPRQGHGLRERDVLMHPFSSFRNKSLTQQAKDAIVPFLSQLKQRDTVSESQKQALQYLSLWAPLPIKRLAHDILSNSSNSTHSTQ